MPHGWAQHRSLCNSSGIHWVLPYLNYLFICLFIKLFLPTRCCSPLGGDASRTSKPLKLVDNFVWGTNDFNPAKNKVSLEDSLLFSKEIEVLFFFHTGVRLLICLQNYDQTWLLSLTYTQQCARSDTLLAFYCSVLGPSI